MSLSREQRATARARRDRVLRLCGALPETSAEPVGEGHLQLRVRRRTFAYYLFDHHGDGKIALCCKSTKEEQRGMVADDPERFYVPAYLGPSGWVSFRLDGAAVEWRVVEALLRNAYAACAPRRLAEAIGSGGARPPARRKR